jgi:tetratricopeptide (TPR) repeat protein
MRDVHIKGGGAVKYGRTSALISCLVFASLPMTAFCQSAVQGSAKDAEQSLSVQGSAKDAEQHYALANHYMQEGKESAAIEEYNKVLALGIIHPEVYNNLGMAYSRVPDGYAKALESYKKATALNPDYDEAYASMGSLYLSKGEYANAASAFKELIRINPRYSRGFFGLGWASLMGKMDNREAVRCFRRAVELDPRYAEAYLGLGLAYVSTGEKELALEPITALRKMNRTDLAGIIEDSIRTGESIQHELLQKDVKSPEAVSPKP